MPDLLIAFYIYLAVMANSELHFLLTFALLCGLYLVRPGQILPSLAGERYFIALLAVSVLSTFAYALHDDFSLMNLAKGFWYTLRPIVYFSAGYMLFHVVQDTRVIIRSICYCAVAVSLQYMANYYTDPGVASALASGNRTYIRDTIGYGTDLWAIAIVCVLFLRDSFEGYRARNAILLLVLATTSWAIWISTGRTNLVWIAVMACGLLGLLPKSSAAFSLILVPVFLAELFMLTPIVSMLGFDMDLSWVQQVPIFGEAAPLNQIYLSDINTHWRGYETYLAFRFMSSLPDAFMIFGAGLSSTVPIGFTFNLGGTDMRDIPFFHNGYSFLIVRSGMVGILLYLTQLISWIGKLPVAHHMDTHQRKMNMLARTILLCSVLSLPTTAGLFGGRSVIIFIIGILLSPRNRARTQM